MLNVAETSAVVFLFICYLHPKKSFQAKPKNLAPSVIPCVAEEFQGVFFVFISLTKYVFLSKLKT